MRYLGRDKAIKNTLSSLKLGPDGSQLTVVDSDQSHITNPKQIMVAKSLQNYELMNMVVEKGVRHVVQMPNQDFARQVSFAAHILSNSEKFFENPRYHLTQLGPKSLLHGTEGLFHYPITVDFNKENLVEKIHHDLMTIPRSSTITASAALVCDELLMNITKDAPMYFQKSYPDQSVVGRGASLTIAYDDERLLIWTEDDYGSLAVDKMVTRLRDCYSTEQVNPLMAVGQGAGLGCKMIFDMCVSMSVLVKPGKKTVFCAMLPLGMSNRQMQGLPKNLQILALTF